LIEPATSIPRRIVHDTRETHRIGETVDQ
jgi:hypothetical protein